MISDAVSMFIWTGHRLERYAFFTVLVASFLKGSITIFPFDVSSTILGFFGFCSPACEKTGVINKIRHKINHYTAKLRKNL